MPDSAPSLLTVRLFGPFEAQVNGEPLPRLHSRKGLWILALLALRSGREVERDWLAGTLWPDGTEAAALAGLRNSLSDLRRALGPAAVRLHSPTSRTLCLEVAGAEIDVLSFDIAIAQADSEGREAGPEAALEQAVAMYRGPLLEGCTEEWAFPERQAREQAYLEALETLAARALERGESRAAERHLRLAVSADPLLESAQRSLMQTLVAEGKYAAAVLAYRELRLRLHREINAEPDAATTALFQQLRAQAREKGGDCRPKSGASGGEDEVVGRPFAHNLPAQLTSFIGREKEIAEVKQFLATTRLLTLTGSGGCGKTRLALQVAADLVEDYTDGVWLVELAPLADPALVPQTVASALGVREEPGRPLTETLVDYLQSKAALLVLDNCEHLLSACAPLANALLRACPRLRVLASSRAGMGIAGERSYRVPSLSLPQLRPLPPVERLTEYEAVRLFVERAVFTQPRFAVTEQNAPAVAQLCQRLDGIPLAIELAAARVKALPVEKLNERLDDMFRLLTGGSRTALPRHQTLRALIDWSYDLLSPPERAMLRRLSVFAGGWTLEAAEGVCGGAVGCQPSAVGCR